MSLPLAPGAGLTPGEQIACLVLPALPMSARWARRQVTAALLAWHVPQDAVQSAELVVSELASNAITVTASKPGDHDVASAQRISVTLRLLPGRVVIEVMDSDPRPPALADVGPDAEDGRGLHLVQAFAKEWGYYAPPSGGKVVFAVLSTSESETARHSGDGTPGTGEAAV